MFGRWWLWRFSQFQLSPPIKGIFDQNHPKMSKFKIFHLSSILWWHSDPKKGPPIWCLFCILGYSKHIIFSWKSPIFWVKRVGTGTPPLPPHLDIVPSLSQVWPPFSCPFFRGSNKLLNWWDIAPPFMYYVFHHIYGQFQGKLSFGQFW